MTTQLLTKLIFFSLALQTQVSSHPHFKPHLLDSYSVTLSSPSKNTPSLKAQAVLPRVPSFSPSYPKPVLVLIVSGAVVAATTLLLNHNVSGSGSDSEDSIKLALAQKTIEELRRTLEKSQQAAEATARAETAAFQRELGVARAGVEAATKELIKAEGQLARLKNARKKELKAVGSLATTTAVTGSQQVVEASQAISAFSEGGRELFSAIIHVVLALPNIPSSNSGAAAILKPAIEKVSEKLSKFISACEKLAPTIITNENLKLQKSFNEANLKLQKSFNETKQSILNLVGANLNQ